MGPQAIGKSQEGWAEPLPQGIRHPSPPAPQHPLLKVLQALQALLHCPHALIHPQTACPSLASVNTCCALGAGGNTGFLVSLMAETGPHLVYKLTCHAHASAGLSSIGCMAVKYSGMTRKLLTL